MSTLANWTPWRAKSIDGGRLAYLIPDANPRTNAGKMSATVVIASEVVDRDGDLVLTDGIDLSDHRRIPNVCLDHQQGMIAGKALDPLKQYSVKKVGKQLHATTYFHKNTRLGEEAFRLVEEGVFPGASLGWPKSSMVCEKRVNEDNGWEGVLYKRIRPHEYSHVPNPSNADCIVRVVEKGFSGKKLSEPLLELLRPMIPERAPVVAGGWEPPMSDTVQKAAPPPKRQPDPYGQQGGAQPPADPMAPVDDPAGQTPDGMDPNATQDPHADAHAAHKDVVDGAVADMMGSIYNQFCDGVIDKARALAMFSHLLDTHGTVTGAGDMDDLGEDPDVSDLGDEDADGIPDDKDADADGDGVPDDEEDSGADEELPKKKAFAAFAKHYQPKMTVVWEFLRRVEGHPRLSIPKVKKKAGEIADLMETLPPIEKALQDGELVLKASKAPVPPDPVLDAIDSTSLVALWEETSKLGARLARVVG